MVLHPLGVWSPVGFPRAQYWVFLFHVFMEKLYKGVECTLNQLMDDAKLSRSVGFLEGRRALQRSLERLDQWSEASCVRFNKAKCQVLSLGHDSPAVLQAWGRVAGK